MSDSSSVLGNFTLVRELSTKLQKRTLMMKDNSTGNIIVCKQYKKQSFSNSKKMQSFIDYAKKVKEIASPFVIHFTTILSDEDNIYFIRPFTSSPSLFELVNNHVLIDNSRVMSLWTIIAQCIGQLANKGISPSLIKPTNIFITDTRFVTLTDIYEAHSDTDWALSTIDPEDLLFKAPEFFERNSILGPSSDVWSLGALLAYMTGAKLPWFSKNVFTMINTITSPNVQIPDNLPQDIKAIVRALLQRAPHNRPPLNRLSDPSYLLLLSQEQQLSIVEHRNGSSERMLTKQNLSQNMIGKRTRRLSYRVASRIFVKQSNSIDNVSVISKSHSSFVTLSQPGL